MTTINVSLPEKLKKEADALVKSGYYASFSDIVRSALRDLMLAAKYNRMADQAKKDYQQGKGTIIRTEKELKNFLKSL